ncbi:DUF1203 domain-containing protein [Sphingomonas sp. LHG3443-2]|uniref:DUF1203 domain-containing protein n=1 Tax=Sphingomonas sp. LHG3443-2 TaxID=2804639 RepID=UPI003CF36B15
MTARSGTRAEVASGIVHGMTYRITGLDPTHFAPLFELSEDVLARRSIVRMAVTTCPGSPCRVSLDDVGVGGTVLLLNHRSIPAGPYAATHAIFVSHGAVQGEFEDEIPPALERRLLSLRAFDGAEMMIDAAMAAPGDADAMILRLFENDAVEYIHAHNATRGCIAAAVERAT